MWFGYPLEIVSDRGKHFLNDVISDITSRYLIKHRKTTPYNPKANGLTKRVNGIVGNILNKMVSAHKTDWDLKLPSAVHAYNTSEKKTTSKSSFFLVFGQNVIHGIELEVESHRIMAPRVKDPETHLIAIEDLEEARKEALTRTTDIQARRKIEFDRKLPKDHGIKVGGMVLLYDNQHKDFTRKLHTRWMGPYKVNYIFPNGSLQLEDLQGVWLDTQVNGSRVKKYVPKDITSDRSSEDTAIRRDSHI